jgi:hypothetical protein
MLGNMSIAGTYRAIRLSRGVRMAHQPPFDLAAMMRLLAMPPSAPHPPTYSHLKWADYGA